MGRRCQNENGGGVKCSSGRVKVVGQKEEAEDTPIQKQQPKASKDGEHTCKKPLLHPSNRPPIPSLLVYITLPPHVPMGKMQTVPTTPATAPTTSLAARGTCWVDGEEGGAA